MDKIRLDLETLTRGCVIKIYVYDFLRNDKIEKINLFEWQT